NSALDSWRRRCGGDVETGCKASRRHSPRDSIVGRPIAFEEIFHVAVQYKRAAGGLYTPPARVAIGALKNDPSAVFQFNHESVVGRTFIRDVHGIAQERNERRGDR